jgi:glyoxylase-like metal-dependent hydrolase (beta-lactamase superfamily II)
MLKGPVRGTGIFVDYFGDSSKSHVGAVYFLTHFHADHMVGLSTGWARGPLYCSAATARLLLEVRKVNRRFVHQRAMDCPFQVDDPVTQTQVTVTFVDAGHCPGSVVIVLEGLSGGAVVHTGDFRFHDDMFCSGALQRVAGSSQDSISQLLDLIDRSPNERIVLHSHGLGDEEILAAVANQFPTEQFLFADFERLAELRIAAPQLTGLSRFCELRDSDLESGSGRRFYVVKNHSQKRRLGLRGIEISCSTLWWAKAVHDEVSCIREPIKDKKGTWHVLWAMHSSLFELRKFQSWLNPKAIEGICPVICHEDSPTNFLHRFLNPQPMSPELAIRKPSTSSPCGSVSPEDCIEVRGKVLESTAFYRTVLGCSGRARATAVVASAAMQQKQSEEWQCRTHEDSLLGILGGSPGNRTMMQTRESQPAEVIIDTSPHQSARIPWPMSAICDTALASSAKKKCVRQPSQAEYATFVGEEMSPMGRAQLMHGCPATQLLHECPETDIEEDSICSNGAEIGRNCSTVADQSSSSGCFFLEESASDTRPRRDRRRWLSGLLKTPAETIQDSEVSHKVAEHEEHSLARVLSPPTKNQSSSVRSSVAHSSRGIKRAYVHIVD